jgi:type VI secretion system ImpC/EvpB family protein
MNEIHIKSDPSSRRASIQPHGNRRPFRIALLGDFSGRSTRLASMRPKLAGVKPISIDPGNFEQVMERLGAEVRLGENGEAPALRFTTMDDFHPDEIYASAIIFEAVRKARKELINPGVFRESAVERPPLPIAAAAGASLLDAIVDASAAAPHNGPRDLWNEALQRIVAPHSLPKPDPRQEEVRNELDSVASEMMRIILSHPDFQSIEAAWRSVFLLLRHLEVNENLSIELIDLSREELFADVLSAPDVRSTGLWRLLVDEAAGAPGAVPWSISAALYTFGGFAKDFEVLRRIASIAKAADAPFVAEAHAALAEQEPSEESAHAWQRLRSLPDARWIGLAFPRFLMRLPYGASTNSVDSFDFEEMPQAAPDGAPDHYRYLWGNPAVACVCLLGETFHIQGFRMRPGSVNRLEGVPIHSYRPNEATPPAECWMTERAAESLLDRGLMPLASVRNSDAVQFIAFRSIAHPAWPLSGFWDLDD